MYVFVYTFVCVNTHNYVAWVFFGMIFRVDYLNSELRRIYFLDGTFKILNTVAEYFSKRSIIFFFHPQSIRLRSNLFFDEKFENEML